MRLVRVRINSESASRTPTHTRTNALTTRISALFLALTLAFSAAFVAPTIAFADYSNPSVSTVAQMRTDGSLHVVEQRSFAFDEPYAAIVWPFTGVTEKQEVEIASVRIIQMDAEGNIVRDWDPLEEVAFQSTWREFIESTGGVAAEVAKEEDSLASAEDAASEVDLPKRDAYSFDKRRNNLYVFLESTENSTVIECDYSITNAALVYDDTAEMYWDYAPEQADVEMSNLRTIIQLPVPEGAEVVPGENIRAWGHGPEGSVDVRADGTVHYSVPLVREGQYAQAHVLFPRSWLTNITVQSKLAKSGVRYDDAVAEEEGWTDTYSWGRVNSLSIDAAVLALCVLVLLLSAGAYALFGREKEEEGTSYESVEPAVLGRLLRWNQHSAYDFTATLEELARRGVITVSADGTDVADVRFRVAPSAKSAKLSSVEQGAMNLLFDIAGDGYQSVSVGEVQAFCKREPARAREAMGKWQQALTEEVRAARVFDLRSKKASRWMFGIAAVLVAFALIAIAGPGNIIVSASLFVTGCVVFAIGYNMPCRTPFGVALAECAEAAKSVASNPSDSKPCSKASKPKDSTQDVSTSPAYAGFARHDIKTTHVISGEQAPTHVISGEQAPTHVISGEQAPTHVISSEQAPTHVISSERSESRNLVASEGRDLCENSWQTAVANAFGDALVK